MKLTITLLAVAALFALDQVSVAQEGNQRSDQMAPRPAGSLYGHAYYRSYDRYPMACGSVVFPRSPLCGDIAPLPWDWECPWWGC